WFTIRLVYRAGKWIFISFLGCLLAAFTLYLTTTVDQGNLNALYFKRFEKDYQYIEQQISRAENNYGIVFNPESIDVLKKWHTESSMEQVMSLKFAFSRNSSVSMDTIILQKIAIKN